MELILVNFPKSMNVFSPVKETGDKEGGNMSGPPYGIASNKLPLPFWVPVIYTPTL